MALSWSIWTSHRKVISSTHLLEKLRLHFFQVCLFIDWITTYYQSFFICRYVVDSFPNICLSAQPDGSVQWNVMLNYMNAYEHDRFTSMQIQRLDLHPVWPASDLCTCVHTHSCRRMGFPGSLLKCQPVWWMAPPRWMSRYMCNGHDQRNISTGQKMKYHPQTAEWLVLQKRSIRFSC